MEENLINDRITELDYYNILNEELICSLCNNILINPIICLKCKNNFCKSCLDEWISKYNKCPNKCFKSFQINSKKNEFLLKIKKLKFKCLECREFIKYKDIKNHFNICSNDNQLMGISRNYDFMKVNFNLNLNIEKISSNEAIILKNQGNKITYITCKKNII